MFWRDVIEWRSLPLRSNRAQFGHTWGGAVGETRLGKAHLAVAAAKRQGSEGSDEEVFQTV